MGERWFEIASPGHFWIQRRFTVLRQLAGGMLRDAREIAEIGCGNGLLQVQIERAYGREVTGFDLNDRALKRNVSSVSSVYCYDIREQKAEFRKRFDLILLFDVLEHIDDESAFMRSALFHLAPSGNVIVNVPAGPRLMSSYDKAVGHKRRYSISSLRKVAGQNRCEVSSWSYWGFPLLPALFLRKSVLSRTEDEDHIISNGFDPKSRVMNAMLSCASRCEPIPQRLIGSSLMTVLAPNR